MHAIRLALALAVLAMAAAARAEPQESRKLEAVASEGSVESWLLGAAEVCADANGVPKGQLDPAHLTRFKNFCAFLSREADSGQGKSLAELLDRKSGLLVPLLPGVTDAYTVRTNPREPAEWIGLPEFGAYDANSLDPEARPFPVSLSLYVGCDQDVLDVNDSRADLRFYPLRGGRPVGPVSLSWAGWTPTESASGAYRGMYRGRVVIRPGLYYAQVFGLSATVNDWFHHQTASGPGGYYWGYFLSPECRARRRIDWQGNRIDPRHREMHAQVYQYTVFRLHSGLGALLIGAGLYDRPGLPGGAALAPPTAVCVDTGCD
jgi:hypothetical protein